MRSEEEASRAIDLYGDTVKRICMLHLKNYSDTEDIFQTVFLKYVLHAPVFDSSEHERAWIIRVTINACKDLLKSFFRSRTSEIRLKIPYDKLSAYGKLKKYAAEKSFSYRDDALYVRALVENIYLGNFKEFMI